MEIIFVVRPFTVISNYQLFQQNGDKMVELYFTLREPLQDEKTGKISATKISVTCNYLHLPDKRKIGRKTND
jgi:hypothetical protein